MPGCARPVGYVPRQTHACDAAVLVRRHLAEFLGRCEERAGPLPAFVKAELEGFAGCGDFELGFVRTCCRNLRRRAAGGVLLQIARLLPLVHGPADAEGAALLVDHVLPAVGYRQWVLSFPGPMAVRLGYDAPLLAAVAGRLARAVMQDMRRSVKQQHGLASVASLHAGVVTVRAALPQRPRPLCSPALPGHRRRVRGAERRRAALPGRAAADAGAHDRRARAGPRGRSRADDDLDIDPALAACSSRSPARTPRPAHSPRRRR
jgi:hypothetical protein